MRKVTTEASLALETFLQAGHEVVAASPNTGINTITGEGLAKALKGAEVVVDLANGPDFADEPIMKFFVTSVVIQRQTGGDLAEILDKISHIIRERFKILGQVQALTGEGRISGIVLMALPIALFFVVYHLNPDYIMLLFTDPLGRKMIAAATVLQILGAIAIKKIVSIKV